MTTSRRQGRLHHSHLKVYHSIPRSFRRELKTYDETGDHQRTQDGPHLHPSHVQNGEPLQAGEAPTAPSQP